MVQLGNAVGFSFAPSLMLQWNELKFGKVVPSHKLLLVIIDITLLHHQILVASLNAQIGIVQSERKASLVFLQDIVFIAIFATVSNPDGISRFAIVIQTIRVGLAPVLPSVILKMKRHVRK